MKTNATIAWGLLITTMIGCSRSTDPDPTPAQADYKACRYVFTYTFQYPTLSPTNPTRISYLDSAQQVKTVLLNDTSFALTVNYKYGDSAFVKFNGSTLYLSKVLSQQRISASSSVKILSGSACPSTKGGSTSSSLVTANTDKVLSSPFAINPFRVGY